MGWLVIGYGQIEVDDEYVEQVLEKAEEYKTEFVVNSDLSFEMSGNKMINYGVLDEIKDWARENKIPMTISVSEYIESEGGYYWNSEEDNEDEDEEERGD